MFDKSPCGLHMGSREPPASVLGLDVKSRIASQEQWVPPGLTNWWSPRYGDHRGILTGYGLTQVGLESPSCIEDGCPCTKVSHQEIPVQESQSPNANRISGARKSVTKCISHFRCRIRPRLVVTPNGAIFPLCRRKQIGS